MIRDFVHIPPHEVLRALGGMPRKEAIEMYLDLVQVARFERLGRLTNPVPGSLESLRRAALEI